jgi:zinc transporter ZupT
MIDVFMLLTESNSAELTQSYVAYTVLCTISLAFIHLYASKLKFLDTIPRSRWLSMASGVSVAYVFVHLLPDLSKQQEIVAESEFLGFIKHHVYLMALVGLTVFYGLERMVTSSKQNNRNLTEAKIYWLHISSFSLYNALIGYLLFHREQPRLISLFTYTFAMGLHFIVNDYGLNQDHQATYRRSGRWILAAAIITGSIVGWSTDIYPTLISVLFSFLAGGIILNVLKEELPEKRQSRFGAFILGTSVYTVLLLTL